MSHSSNAKATVTRHDIKNALLCVRRMAEILPDLQKIDENDLKTLSDELMHAADLIELSLAKVLGERS